MDTVSQHGSSSGYIHDGPDFLIAQQHLQAVADMLASTTFQAMDVDPRADATASASERARKPGNCFQESVRDRPVRSRGGVLDTRSAART